MEKYPGKPFRILLLLLIFVSWTIAAFGEEMSYRGYLFNRITNLMGENRFSPAIAIFAISIFFGFAHAYPGVTGIVETFFSGMLFSALYVLARRNLWMPIITHGMVDTIGFLLVFFGLCG